jgi:hypothetical protein
MTEGDADVEAFLLASGEERLIFSRLTTADDAPSVGLGS